MKKLAAITFTSMMLLLATAMVVGAVDTVEIRGKVATDTATWTADDFAGFYYDIDDDIKTETMTMTVSEGKKLLEPDGVTYNTEAMADDFDFEEWGSYNVIGFMADKYFAGYIDTPDTTDDILFTESDDENVLSDEQLLKILVDDDDEMTVTSGTPLKLEEGYELSIKSIDIDGNKVYLELSKDGSVVDSKVISPSADNAGMKDKTYYYKKDIGDSKDLVIVAAHFKNAFRGADQNLATVDGLWQLSDEARDVSENTEYDKMTIQTVTANAITMNNEDNDITLSKNKDISLMPGVAIKTADSDDDALRYYPYKEITEPGTYEVRGDVATDTATWSADEFAGFYYDIDDDIKTETMTMTVSEGKKLLEPDGVTYNTEAMADDFEFEEWGQYNVIGFMADKYFAGYLDTPDTTDDILFTESDDENVLSDEQLLKILVDDDDEMTVTSGTPLKLEEGYELSIKSIDIDGNKVYLELSKDGSVVDSKVISPSADNAGMKDKTYYYKKDIGDSKDVVIVAAHFKNAFRGADQNLATVDGLWQLSDEAKDVSENTEYDKMTIQTVNADSIMMNNEDNDITLSKNKDITLMPGVSIKTADSDDDALRYYIYKEVTEPGTYEIRGAVATDTATWTADNFAGFYYDLDDNIKTEEMTATVSEGKKLLEPDGVVYNTKAMADDFDFEDWGKYNVIGFMADKYFAGYLDTPDTTDDILFTESDDENVLSDEQLLKILKDDDTEMTVTSGTPLKLEEGYELAIKSIDIDGNKVYLELSKDGSVVDSKVISPSADNAGMKDKTYYYKKDIGDSKDVVIVAAHFKNAFRGADQNLATVDGLWQLSDEAKDVSENTEYDKMTIQTVNADSIMMNNEDNDITLSKNKDITLMPGVSIKTADSDDDALRYYIYKDVTIEGAAAEVAPATEVKAAPVEEAKVAETPAEPVVAEANNTTTEVKAEAPAEVKETENKTAEPATEEKKNETAEKTTPGFESVFALTGLLAVAYLVLGRRE